MTDKPQEETIKDRITGLLDKGYTRGQLIRDFSFAERTVDNAIKEYKESHSEEADETKGGGDPDVKALMLPAKLDIKQVIAPEYLIKHLSFVNGDQRQTFIDALLVYEAARRSVMEDVNILHGLAAAQAQTTETQLRVLREAKSESKEVAQEAAHQTALEIANYIDQRIPKGEPPGGSTIADRMLGPMADMAGKQMANMFGRMFGMPIPEQSGEQPQVPSGWEYKNEGGEQQ